MRAIIRFAKDRVTVLCPIGHLIESRATGPRSDFAGSAFEAELGAHAHGQPNRFDRAAAACNGAGHAPRIDIHGDSPEATGVYECPACGEREQFIGVDAHGWGGPAECDGSCGWDPDDDESTCSCETVLVQDFRVVEQLGTGPLGTSIDYSSFEGGSDDASIGTFTTIVCGECHAIVWENDSDDDRLIGRAKAEVRA